MRTIAVKGTGSISAKPDLITIALSLESADKDYEKLMRRSAEKTDALGACLEKVGFAKTSLKTTDFNVDARYDNEKNEEGVYVRKFKGYVCIHRMKVEFDFDAERLAKTLQAVAGCAAKPELNISFTVKDSDAVSEALLRAACENAKNKAKVLCDASGVKLGALVSVDYDCKKHDFVSPTRYAAANDCMAAPLLRSCAAVDFTPEDIKVKDTVAFVWEIE